MTRRTARHGTSAVAITAVLLAATVTACGGAPTGSSDPAQRSDTASFAVTVLSPLIDVTDFSYEGNSVEIYGKRNGAADFKYPCASEFRECLQLDQAGTSKTVIKDLCPTENVNIPGDAGKDGTWTFSYKIFLGLDCTGVELTAKDGDGLAVNNLVCENSTPEPLHAGTLKTNTVLCKTWNAAKDISLCIYDPVTGAHSGTCTGFDLGSIGDLVWSDLNGNGVQDAGEPGIANVTVQLKNSAGLVIQATTTDLGGHYLFTGLGAGAYTVVIPNAPAGAAPTTALVGDAGTDSNGSPASVTLATSNSSDLTVDFGFVYPRGSIGNFVWEDVDGDGVQYRDEAGIGGVTVELRSAAGDTLLATRTTNVDGHYLFEGLAAGTYSVWVVTPAGATPTNSLMGDDREVDSNVSGATVVLATPGGSDLTVDFGFVYPRGRIGDFVWDDRNANGIQDGGEPPIAGVSVQLKNSGGAVIQTTTTDATGHYLFTGLFAGSYTVTVATPSGFAPTTSHVGDDRAVDSDDRAGTLVNLAWNDSSDLTIDFGFVRAIGRIGDFVWHDVNQDGLQSAGEPGIPGVTVTLSQDGVVIRTTTTGADGKYLFDQLVAGTYVVDVINPTGYTPTLANVGGDEAIDSDGAGASVTLPYNDSSNLDVDFGFFVPPVGSIGDFVWSDVDHDGLQDAGEPPITGVMVVLADAGGNVVGTQFTDQDGHYLFTGVPAGTYTVTVTTPAGYGPTTPNAGGDDAIDSDGIPAAGSATATVVVPGGATDLTIDFGFIPPSLTLVKTASPTSAAPFQPILFSYTVTNTGGVTLTNVVVTDDHATPDSSADDVTLGPITLAPGASQTVSESIVPVTSTISAVLGGAGPSSGFAVLSLGGDSSHPNAGIFCSKAVVGGNLGVASTYGNLTSNGQCAYATGTTFYRGDSVTYSGWSPRPVVTDDAKMNQLQQDVFHAASYFAALTPTQTVAGGAIALVGGTRTLTGVAGMNVLNLSSFELRSWSVLTLTGPPGTQWVINVAGRYFVESSTIALGPNLTTADVVFNITNPAATIGTQGENTITGILLAPYNAAVLIDRGPLNGILIGGYNQVMTLRSATHVTAPPITPPVIVTNTATATATVGGITVSSSSSAAVTLNR